MKQNLHADLALAATLHLLSSSVVRGITPAKTHALLVQLRILVTQENLDPVLRSTCAELLAQWRETQNRFDTQPSAPQPGAAMQHSLH